MSQNAHNPVSPPNLEQEVNWVDCATRIKFYYKIKKANESVIATARQNPHPNALCKRKIKKLKNLSKANLDEDY